MKIVLIGAGSRSFGRGQIADVLHSKELRGRGVTLTLVDTDDAALETMTKLAERMKERLDSDVRLESTTDRRKALPGADYVLVAVARRRMELWEQDFRVPLSYGFRHCLGENGGPGAVFHALRSFELVIPICRDVEELCPDAWLFNFTNPEARVLHAVLHLTKVKGVGFCHGVFDALHAITRYLGRPLDELDIISAGINHCYTILRLRDKKTGEDLFPALLRKVAEDKEPRNPLFKKLAEVFGIFTYPSDDHIGEYLAYGSDYSGVKWHYGRESWPVPRKDVKPQGPSLEDYAEGRAPLDDQIMRPTGELTVPIICDMLLDRGTYRWAVNVLNTGRYIDNLATDGVVEIPATVDRNGIHPMTVGSVPEPFAAVMRTQMSINACVTEGYRTRTKRPLLQALLLDPNVNSVIAAEKLLDYMLGLQREYLPSFA